MDINNKKNISGAQFTQPPEEFLVRSATSGVSFDLEQVQPYTEKYVGVDDFLTCAIWGTVGNQGAIVNVRMLGLDGLIHPLTFSLPTNNSRTPAYTNFQLMEGWILSATAQAAVGIGGGVLMSCIVGITRNPKNTQSIYDILIAGYINNSVPQCWPQSVPTRQTDGAGAVLRGLVGAPAAGAELIYTIPAGARQRLISFEAGLTTAAAVANRVVALLIDDGANVTATIPSNNTQVASTTATYTFADGAQLVTAAAGNNYQASPANCYLEGGWRVRTLTAGIQAADQWTAANLQLIDWNSAL